MADDDIRVTDAPEQHRYEIRVGDALAGFAVYHLRGGRRLFVHTEIDPAYEGQGLGSRLAGDALDLARTSGEPVVPICPFIAGYIERHPEHLDLVDRALLERLDQR